MKTIIRLLIVLSVVCSVGFLLKAQAVSPPPDGGYPGFNTAEGRDALLFLNTSTGIGNTAVGAFSLKSNVDASFNTAVGAGTLLFNTAPQNTAIGAVALLLNTTGQGNTAVGTSALLNNTEGEANTATGGRALTSNTTGTFNTANGEAALFSNTTGSLNTAIGLDALRNNTTGSENTAVGVSALLENNEGGNNTAIGEAALIFNSSGIHNTAVGYNALGQNTTDSNNTAVGYEALLFKTSGIGNIALGTDAGVNLATGNDNIYIGSFGPDTAGSTESNTIRIGKGFEQQTFIAGINGVTLGGGSAVQIDVNGQLGTTISSRRFKHQITRMDKASESILALKPVSFQYRSDDTNTPQFGLIAEEVAEVNPHLVMRDKNGEIYTVRYDAVNAMLLNEFLKEHRTVQALEALIIKQQKDFEQAGAKQRAQIQALIARLDEQDARIQRVNEQTAIPSETNQVATINP